MADSSTPKGRATPEQMAQLKSAVIQTLDRAPLGVESFRALMLFFQTVSLDGMRGQLVGSADARPGRPPDFVFTTSHASVVIDMVTRKAIA